MLLPVGEAHPLEQIREEGCFGSLARDRERQEDVLLGGQHRQKVEELEHEADVLAAEHRDVAVAQGPEHLSGDRHLPVRRAVERGEEMHQRGFA